MADKKITDLVDGGVPQATDEFVIARAGDNFKIDWASIDQELLDQAVILAPASSTRNVIVPTGDFIALAFEGSATRTEPMVRFTDLITGLAPPYVFELIDANGNILANFYSEKYFTTTDRSGIYGTAAFTTAGVQLGNGSLSGQGFLDLGVDVSHTPYPIYVYDFDTGETIFFITAAGNPVFGGAAATPNSDLTAGDWSAYLDPTNGAAKMLFKAKTLDGTVVTWTIPSGTVYVVGGTDVAVADGGTGASTASGARTNLGLVIGTDVPGQAAFDDHSARHEDGGADEISITGLSGDPADTVNKTLFDANTILKADSDNTPVALTMGASTILARLAAGNIVAATPAEINTLLGWTTVTKAVDESVSSSVTYQADDALFFATVAGAIYEVELTMIFASPAGGGTPDIRFGFGEDTTIRGAWNGQGLSAAEGLLLFQQGLQRTSGGLIAGTATANRALRLAGTYWGNGGTAELVWAQGTSDINATIMRAGSVLRYRRVL